MKTFLVILKNAVIISLMLLAIPGYSQHWEWAKGAYDYYHDSEDVTTDTDGNIYMVHMDFWNESIAVTKMNPQGTVLWDKQVACCATLSYGMRIAVNNAGNVYILGEYESKLKFGSITLQTGNPSSNQRYTFLAKLNAQGNVVWAKNAAGPTVGFLSNLQERDIMVDPQGKIVITGTVKGTAYFDNIVLQTNNTLATAFVAKYHANGNIVWVNRATGGASHAASLDTDNQGRIYAIGYYDGAGGAPQWGNISLPVPYGVVSYFTKLSTSGNVVWSKKINGKVEGIATNGAGSSYISGYFTGTANMGNGITLTSAGGSDMMLARYNGSGNVIWARSAGGTAPDYGYDLDIDQDGNCYVVGEYQSATATFGTETLGLTAGLDGAGFAARYLPNGTIDWVEPIIPKDYTKAERISTTTDGKCHILTSYKYSNGSLKFGSDITLTNAGSNDVIAKLDGHAIRIPILKFYEAFICFPCFPFDPVLDYEYRFWSERAGVKGATYRKVSGIDNRDEILWKGDRLEIKLHDELSKGTHYFQLRAVLRDGSLTAWTEVLAFEVEKRLQVALVYPNPVKEQLSIEYEATGEETLLLTLYDRNGKVLLRENKAVGEGKNTLEVMMPSINRVSNPLTLQLQSKLQGTTVWQLIRE